MSGISLNKVTYQGGFITNNSMEKINNVLKERGVEFLPRLVEDCHVTITYFDDKKLKNDSKDPIGYRKSFIIPNKDLGRVVSVKAIAYGEYNENGNVLNQGLEIDLNSLKAITLSDGRTLADLFTGVKPHITLALSDIKDENEKFIAKAVDTYKCDFTGENSFRIDIDVELVLKVCRFNLQDIEVLYD